MTVITIPKKLIKNNDLVAIPRKECERFLSINKKNPIQDWIYEKPFLSELKKGGIIAKKELKNKKIGVWRGL